MSLSCQENSWLLSDYVVLMEHLVVKTSLKARRLVDKKCQVLRYKMTQSYEDFANEADAMSFVTIKRLIG